MTILQFGVFPPPNGGVQTNVKAIRDYARELGHRCGVVNLSRHRQADADDVFFPGSAFEVMKLAARFPAKILHFHLGGQIQPKLLGLYLFCSFLPGRRTVLTFHSGGYPSSPEGKSARAATLRGFVFRRIDRIVAVNPEIAALFQQFGVPAARIRQILPHSFPSALPQVAWPERLGRFLKCHSPILVTVGLLEPEYGLELQIDALKDLRTRYPHAGLVIAGSGSQEQELRRYIDTKQHASDVLLYGDLPRDVTLNLIARADVFLRTTLYDGDSVSVREALHFGTPVVATENGMRPDGVITFPVHSRERLVDAVEKQLQTPRAPFVPHTTGHNENLRQVLAVYQELV